MRPIRNTRAGTLRPITDAGIVDLAKLTALEELHLTGSRITDNCVVRLAKDNKGKRDVKIPLHPIVVDHLRKLKSFSPLVFPTNRSRRVLFSDLQEIQKAAGIKLTGPKSLYGFHDLRRAFATMNADNLTPDALQALMQHKDYQTTQRYISMARQLNPAVANLFVPTIATA